MKLDFLHLWVILLQMNAKLVTFGFLFIDYSKESNFLIFLVTFPITLPPICIEELGGYFN